MNFTWNSLETCETQAVGASFSVFLPGGGQQLKPFEKFPKISLLVFDDNMFSFRIPKTCDEIIIKTVGNKFYLPENIIDSSLSPF